MKKIFTILIFIASWLTIYAATPDDVKTRLSDFDAVVSLAENDYGAFMFRVNDETRKEYRHLKKRIRNNLKKGKCSWKDAVFEYIDWFGDANFYPVNTDANEHFDFSKYEGAYGIDYTKRMDVYNPKFMSCKVLSDTWLIRMPEPDSTKIEMSIKEYEASGCPYLVLDLRGNSGESDIYAFELLFINKPYRFESGMFRNSPDNRAREWADMEMEEDEDFRAVAVEWLKSLETSNEEYVKAIWIENDTIWAPDTIMAMPQKVAIIIDNQVAGYAEGAVIDAVKGSDKTIVYGKDNTSGCAFAGRDLEVDFKNRGLKIFYSPAYLVDSKKGILIGHEGLEPDVKIPLQYPKRLEDNLDEWVFWVAQDLKERTVPVRQ